MEQIHTAALPTRLSLPPDSLPTMIHIRLSALARLEAERTLASLPENVVRSLLACLGHATKKIQRGAATVLISLCPPPA